jgi:hypothetical protein
MEDSLGGYLSRNKPLVRTVEDDAEAFHMILSQYLGLVEKSSPKVVRNHILGLKAKDSKSQLPRIMRSPEILALELRFFECAPFFHLTKPMSKVWITKHLMGCSGGVSHLWL